MATITTTEEYDVSVKKRYVISITGYAAQTTSVQWFQDGTWHTMDGTTKTADWAERDLQPPTSKIRVKYVSGTGDLDVELSPNS